MYFCLLVIWDSILKIKKLFEFVRIIFCIIIFNFYIYSFFLFKGGVIYVLLDEWFIIVEVILLKFSFLGYVCFILLCDFFFVMLCDIVRNRFFCKNIIDILFLGIVFFRILNWF